MKNMKPILAAALVLGLVTTADRADAAGGIKPPIQDWHFNGIFATYDKAALQRGFQVFKAVCSSCHSLDLIAFRNFADIGYNEDEVKALADEYEVEDGPDEFGEMFFRTAIPSDYWPSPFPNEQAAAAANGGAVPPDLSLIAKARASGGDSAIRHSLAQPGGFALGADYVYALLTGYRDEPPEGFDLPPGKYYNDYFPGHAISMAPPLWEEAVEYADGTPATVEQMAYDVTAFLQWAAEPELDERKNMGIKVILFLIVLTALLYALKRRIWADVH